MPVIPAVPLNNGDAGRAALGHLLAGGSFDFGDGQLADAVTSGHGVLAIRRRVS